MAVWGGTPHEQLESARVEIAALTEKLEKKTGECDELKEQLEAAKGEASHAHRAGVAALSAAQVQMQRLQADLAKAQGRDGVDGPPTLSTGFSSDGQPGQPTASGFWSTVSSFGAAKSFADEAQQRCLQQEARHLRLDLRHYQQKVEAMQVQQQHSEQENTRMRSTIGDLKDSLDYTRQLVKHHEVEQQLQQELNDTWGGENPCGIGKKTLELRAEQKLREHMEKRNNKLTDQIQKLTSCIANQQLAIQRLEKKVMQGQKKLLQKDQQLVHVTERAAQLQGYLRRDMYQAAGQAIGSLRMDNAMDSQYSEGLDSDINGAGAGNGRLAKSQSSPQLPRLQLSDKGKDLSMYVKEPPAQGTGQPIKPAP
jgi:chromosome segregation ATPase